MGHRATSLLGQPHFQTFTSLRTPRVLIPMCVSWGSEDMVTIDPGLMKEAPCFRGRAVEGGVFRGADRDPRKAEDSDATWGETQSKVSSLRLAGKCYLTKMNSKDNLDMEEKSQMDNPREGLRRTIVGP